MENAHAWLIARGGAEARLSFRAAQDGVLNGISEIVQDRYQPRRLETDR
jgi:hypothetical protein